MRMGASQAVVIGVRLRVIPVQLLPTTPHFVAIAFHVDVCFIPNQSFINAQTEYVAYIATFSLLLRSR
jgi:hypothetical protein